METFGGTPGEVRVTVCARTDQGRRRRSNQDRFLVADLSAAADKRSLLEGGEKLSRLIPRVVAELR